MTAGSFTVGVTSIAYAVTGTGPPLVLAHGAEADRRMFDTLVPELATTATVIAYDQRDCGGSTTAADEYDLAALADDLVALLDHLGLDRADILGQSLGGVIAQLVATRHPDRVDRVVLASTFRGGASLAVLNPTGFSRLVAARSGGTERARAELFLTPDFVASAPTVLDAWRRIAPTTTADERARRAAAMQRPIEPVELAAIAAPTLVVHGTEDQIVPIEHARENAAAISDAWLAELPGVGHVSPLQAPAELAAAVVDHLARTRSS